MPPKRRRLTPLSRHIPETRAVAFASICVVIYYEYSNIGEVNVTTDLAEGLPRRNRDYVEPLPSPALVA